MAAEDDIDSFVLNSADEKAVAHWVFVNQKSAGAGTDTLMGGDRVLYAGQISGQCVGCLGAFPA